MRLLPTAVATAAAAVAAGGSAASAADFGQAVGEAQLGACLEHWVGLACQVTCATMYSCLSSICTMCCRSAWVQMHACYIFTCVSIIHIHRILSQSV